MRNAFGHVIPSPEIVHSTIQVEESNPADDGAKGYTLTFKEFKEKFNRVGATLSQKKKKKSA